MFFFFFQAEDGIRDVAVTGVQTCALPISPAGPFPREVEPRARGAPPRGEQQSEQPTARGGRRRWWGTAGRWRGGGQRRPGWRRGRRLEPVPGGSDPALDRSGGTEHAARPHGSHAAGGRAGGEGLVIAALGLLAALQGAPPNVTARVDRARLTAGEELRLTVRARSRTAEPVTVVLPALTGFAITGSREVTEVTIEGLGAPVRTTTRELALRAQRVGTLVIGPVRVRQGGHDVATAPITVTVDSAAVGLATALSPIARSLLDAAPPPAHNDQVAVTVIVPGDSVLVGQQVDVIAAAWFPRELRERLRRAPILTMQTPEGVWAYPGAAPTAVAASRLVHGRWMDLFVAHQAVFPLTRGPIVIPPAVVDYAVPVSFSFFSREDRYSLRSDTVSLTALPLPASGRAAGRDQRVAAQGLDRKSVV